MDCPSCKAVTQMYVMVTEVWPSPIGGDPSVRGIVKCARCEREWPGRIENAEFDNVLMRMVGGRFVADPFKCPRCGMVSHNPTDMYEGYCGNCRDWTRQ